MMQIVKMSLFVVVFILSACGMTTESENPDSDGGTLSDGEVLSDGGTLSDGEVLSDDETPPFDVWGFLYSDCVDLCEIANEGAAACGVQTLDMDYCIRLFWNQLAEPRKCRAAVECYEKMFAEGPHCENWDRDDWGPSLFKFGCPY